jgi:hypothetical protein
MTSQHTISNREGNMKYEIVNYNSGWDEYTVNVYREDGTIEIANNIMDGDFIRSRQEGEIKNA